MRSRLVRLIAIAFCAAILSAPATAGEGRIGIVLMHGKGSTALPKSPVGKLEAALQREGFLVATPYMPWSKKRNLAKGYEESMAEIDAAVEGLKAQGAERIAVGGHSMGANAALGYGARREGLAGVLALAPGHVPELEGYQKSLGYDWKRADAMVAQGKGDQLSDFNDNDQGRRFTIKARARDYLEWFAPDGPAPIPKNAAALKPGTPLLWVVGKADRMFARGEGYAYAKAPRHEKSLYLVVEGGHIDASDVATPRIVEWLKGL